MSLRDKLARASAGVAFGLAGILGSQASAASVVKIETEVPAVLVRGNNYQMNVRANTTSLPTTKFNSVGWDVVVPSYFTIAGATLPDGTNNSSGPSTNPSDFFYLQGTFDGVMDSSWNRVDSSVSGGELTDNVRIVNNVFNGPSNRSYSNGLLGIYSFSVNSDAPLGNGNFGLDNVAFGDTNFNEYNYPGSGVSVSNDTFTVAKYFGDNNLDNKVDIDDLSSLAASWQSTQTPRSLAGWQAGDYTGNGTVNMDDLSLLAANWQAGVSGGGISFTEALTRVGLSGAGIPEPSTALLLGAAGMYALSRRGRFGGGGGTARNDGMYDGTLGEQDLGSSGRRERPIIRK